MSQWEQNLLAFEPPPFAPSLDDSLHVNEGCNGTAGRGRQTLT